jgi:hypothetical protein
MSMSNIDGRGAAAPSHPPNSATAIRTRDTSQRDRGRGGAARRACRG